MLLAFILTILFLSVFAYLCSQGEKYPDAPTLRVSTKPGTMGTLEDKMMYVTDIMKLLDVGWERYSKKGINYILLAPTRKFYIVAHKYLDEVRRAPETHVSNLASNNETMQTRYTLHPKLMWDQYHFDIPIRKSLTQSLGPKLRDIADEGKLALNQFLGSSKDWECRPIYRLGFEVTTRTANRLLFGIDLARDAEFQNLSIEYSEIMFGGAEIIRSYPELLKPIVMWWKTDIYRAQALAKKILCPIIKARIEQGDRYIAEGRQAEWEKIKADDAIQWVLDVSPRKERVPDLLVYRMLHINISAVHTSSVTFLEIILNLSVTPEYHEELRDEIVQIFRQERGWTKQALTYLVKMDSYCTETMRLNVLSSFKLGRKVIKDWQLSDGIKIPKGTFLFCNHSTVVQDADYFENPHHFDPWRMFRLRQRDGEANKHQFVMTSDTNLAFGHGKHACPGRFFAANEIKTLLVLFLMRYDFEATNLKGGIAEVKKGRWFNSTRLPIDHAIIKFRERTSRIPEDLRVHFV